jgi:hypothetical protein
MARLVREPVDVTVAAGQPSTFLWRNRLYQIVECADNWRDTGEWWAGEHPKDFWRVRTDSGGVFDIYSEQGEAWVLYKSKD